MKSFFNNPTLPLTQNAQKALSYPFNFLRVEAVSGAVTFRFTNGDWITARSGRVYSALPGEYWDKVEFTTADATAEIEITIGIGGTSSGGSAAGAAAMSGTSLDPNADGVVPEDTSVVSFYYSTTALALFVWNTSTQTWN